MLCFFLIFFYFSELCQFCCSAFVLPAWCVYTHLHRGKTEKGKSPEYFKIFEKNTIFNEQPVAPLASYKFSKELTRCKRKHDARGIAMMRVELSWGERNYHDENFDWNFKIFYGFLREVTYRFSLRQANVVCWLYI